MGTSYRPFGLALALCFLSYGTSASADCDATLVTSMRDAQRLVTSMRADKPGQARVFAADGSEYSAGLVRWMAAELVDAEKNCREGNFAAAGAKVAAVQETLAAHARR